MKLTTLLALALLSLTACTTLPNGNVAVASHEITPQAVQRDMQIGARLGVRLALHDDPNSRDYFTAALAVLDASINSKTYDPKLIQGALFTISVKEVRDVRVIDGIQSVLELYNAHFSEIIAKKLDQNLYLGAALTGLRDGIAAGLTP